MSNSRILLVTDEMLLGGVALHVVLLANKLVAHGASVSVCATDGPMKERLDKRVRFVETPMLRQRSFEKKEVLSIPRVVGTLYHEGKRMKADLIHSHKRYSDLLARVAARSLSVPHLSTCHSAFQTGRLFSVFGDVTIACAESVRQSIIMDFKKTADRVQTNYYGIEPLRIYSQKEIAQGRSELGIETRKRVLASIGHLSAYKDRRNLLEAVRLLVRERKFEDAILLIVGDGEEKGLMKKCIENYQLAASVRLLPSTANIELVMNCAEFLLLSSAQREGIPYVFLEAASIGKPHVSTNVGGVKEFIQDGETGKLVPPKDPRALADGMSQLLRNRLLTRNLGEGARKLYNERHRIDQWFGSTMDVYDRLLTGASPT